MGTLVMAWLRANWFAAGVALVRGVDWAGVVARVFSYLLKRASQQGSYKQVRLVASRVVEQASYVLAVTEDGEISPEESEKLVAAARRLLDAWGNGAGKGVTRAIEAEIKQVVEVQNGQAGQAG